MGEMIDPITREIIQHALASAADEMALALYRTAYSTIVRDCLDYSTSLCNGAGDMIALPACVPHVFRNAGDGQLRLLGIHASPSRIVHRVQDQAPVAD